MAPHALHRRRTAFGLALAVALAPVGARTAPGARAADAPGAGEHVREAVAERAEVTPLEREIVDATNRERARAGLKPLQIDATLVKAARQHSGRMAQRGLLSHDVGNGGPAERVQALGYAWMTVGENVAFNQRGGAEVVSGWMESPRHRENILNPDFRQIGVGVARDSAGRPYFTQVFGSRMSQLGDVATTLRFSIRNESGAQAQIEVPGAAAPSSLAAGATTRMSVSFIRVRPDVRIAAGGSNVTLAPEDGAAYVLRRGSRGALVLDRAAGAGGRAR